MYLLWKGQCKTTRLDLGDLSVRVLIYGLLGHCEANSCRHLELQLVQKSHCWRSVDGVYISGCYHPQVRSLSLGMDS